MWPDRDATSLSQMLSHAREAVDMARGRVRQDLSADRMLELALVRLVEIVGEAASRVGEETRREVDAVPWRVVVAMRNRLIHGYDAVDLDVLWTTVTTDLPELIDTLEAALADPDRTPDPPHGGLS